MTQVAAQSSLPIPAPTGESKPQVLVINQVRGTECCDPGSLAHLQQQLAAHQRLNVPATFTLRYDVLHNASFVNSLTVAHQRRPDLISVGLLLEITPELARAAGVEYQGTPDNWYEAQHVFTIGYAQADRYKLMDTLFEAFKKQFGQYPEVTTAWINDTPTLIYLHDKYGVKLHQITREQWGVDSYTLVGGPPHYPYPASRNWVFMPEYGQEDPLWIVRQTVTDPLYNYGDTSSSFTSQPNDYARGQRDLTYFKALVSQALMAQPQNQTGFALVGLENSMAKEYQDAFVAQLEYLHQLQNEDKLSYFDLDKESLMSFQSPVNVYEGHDLIGESAHQSWWISSPHYRVRLRTNNNQLFIDDLRIFSADIVEPYQQRVALNKGYWIAPGLLDGSLWYGQVPPRPFLVKLFGPPEVKGVHFVPAPDLGSHPLSLVLPAVAPGTSVTSSVENQEILVQYLASDQAERTIRFQTQEITFHNFRTRDFACPDNIPTTVPLRCRTTPAGLTLEWLNQAGEPQYGLVITCKDTTLECQARLHLTAEKIDDLRTTQYPFFFPEARPRELSEKYSLLYAHNRYAIAGRNPVRLVLVAADTTGFPTLPNHGVTVTAEPEIAYTSSKQESLNSPLQLVDLINNKPQKTTITVTVDDDITKTMTVYFAPNCKQEIRYCLTHPRQAWWYVNTIVRDKIRARVLGETQS